MKVKEMRMHSIALLLTTTELESSPGPAQNVEQVKPAFGHVLSGAKGKRLVAPCFRDGNWISAGKMER
jgi:hypothetical protein